jgi:hypothetical protein
MIGKFTEYKMEQKHCVPEKKKKNEKRNRWESNPRPRQPNAKA